MALRLALRRRLPLRTALPLSAVLAAALLAGCASSSSSPQGAEPKPAPTAAPAAAAAAPQAAASAGSTPAAAVQPAAASPGLTPQATEAISFAQWREQFTRQALAAGISAATVQKTVPGMRLRPQVVQLDQAQPEFTRTPWAYLDTAVSATRINAGRQKMQASLAPLKQASQSYGVPVQVIAAIWGMESNYGANFGNTPTLDALATLAFEGRRAAWARTELLAALRIIDSGDIDARHMVGSWAGAMGHTQFLPSTFLAYAVDADGDGRRDIWGSLPDVFASTAHYLARSGWKADEPWGQEVRLPSGFDHDRADPAVRQSSAQWAAEGVSSISGQPLPAMEQASLVTPAGARGPAFLAGANFRSILRYNNSVNYALAVGLLSQQLTGGPGVQAAWPRDLAALSREQLRSLQTALSQQGLDAGAADGVMGPATRAALRQYQRQQGLVADGYPTLELLQRLLAQP